jgi:hypothetical protein
VMDDNRLFTLASNERIRMLQNMKMIFEIRDLAFASPATVTRAGVLYVNRPVSNLWLMHAPLPCLACLLRVLT